jgi:hypothetical protein
MSFQAVLVASLIASATAFAPSSARANVRSSSLQSSEESEPVAFTAPPVKKARLPAQWLPVGNNKAPITLDGSLAGDVGFDPLGFSKSKKTLFWMREVN